MTATDVFTESTSCTATGTTDGKAFTVLQNNPDEIAAGVANLFPGPLALGNIVGMFAGTWTHIYASDFADDNLVEYGNDSISFTFGEKNAGVSFTTTDSSDGANAVVVPGQKIQFTIDDNGLNLDPTTADAYTFVATSGSETVQRSHVSTDSDLKSSLAALGFGDSGFLTISEDTTISSDSLASTTTTDSYTFTETASTLVYSLYTTLLAHLTHQYQQLVTLTIRFPMHMLAFQ